MNLSADFDGAMARLGPFSASRRVAVACSGGADSLCLTLLAAAWGNVLALIVDHGLRAESAAEARVTAERLAARGIAHRILTLSDVGRSAAAARSARYAALICAARAAGILDVLLGHHAGDQAETVLMRRRAGSGPAGLAGMAAIVNMGDVRLLRPLLHVAPARLRDVLRAEGVDWVEDPTNLNPAYLRGRLRREVGEAGLAGDLTAAAMDHGVMRAAVDARVAVELAARVAMFPEGYAVLSPGAISPAALGGLVRAVSGGGYLAGGAALTRAARDPGPCSLGGVQILAAGRTGDGWLVVREAAAMHAPVPAADGAFWDGRFRLHMPRDASRHTIGALGADAVRFRAESVLPAVVLRTLPALRCDGVLAAVPHIGYRGQPAFEGVTAWFTPAHSLAGVPFEVGVARTAADGCVA